MDNAENKNYNKAWNILNKLREKHKNDEGWHLRSVLDEVELYSSGYAEPGYEGNLIATGNWNEISHWNEKLHKYITDSDVMPKLASKLEKLGFQIEWGDEWGCCESCLKLIRTSRNSYSWTMSGCIDDNGVTCGECLKENSEEYLKSLEGESHRAVTLATLDPADHGYVLVKSEFEHGFYDGQNDSPVVIAKSLRDVGIERFLFRVDSVGQFDLSFSVYVHEDEKELLKELSLKSEGPSVSDALERGLKEAAVKMKALDGDGIKFAQIQADGTANVRLVSPEEFVEGIKS